MTTLPAPIRHLKYLLVTALVLNALVFTYLMIVFLVHRSAAQALPDPDQFALIEKTLQAQPADKGRKNAIELLSKSNTSLAATVELVRRGFYCTAALLIANIVISAACVHKLRAVNR